MSDVLTNFSQMLDLANDWRYLLTRFSSRMDPRQAVRHSRRTTKGDLDKWLQGRLGVEPWLSRAISNQSEFNIDFKVGRPGEIRWIANRPEPQWRAYPDVAAYALESLSPMPYGYRVGQPYRHRGPATDIIAYESDELGNDIKVLPGVMEILAAFEVTGSKLVWVTLTPEMAERYGDDVERLEFAGKSVVIGQDDEAGQLVWTDYEPDLQRGKADADVMGV
ncbi:MAG: hypothetical protein FOGNACKC_00836 [Anaerolineae bacterium]|nr:hypothetical protein [Anaerolineae bacterium]